MHGYQKSISINIQCTIVCEDLDTEFSSSDDVNIDASHRRCTVSAKGKEYSDLFRRLDFIVNGLFLLLRSGFRRHYCRFSRLNPAEKNNADTLDVTFVWIETRRFLPVPVAYALYVDLPDERLLRSLTDWMYFSAGRQLMNSLLQIVCAPSHCSVQKNSELSIFPVPTRQLPGASAIATRWLRQPAVHSESVFVLK